MSELCLGNCAGCPMVAGRLEEIVTGRTISSELANIAMDQAFESEVAAPLFEVAKARGIDYIDIDDEVKEIESEEELASLLRMGTGGLVDAYEKEIDKDEEQLKDFVKGCRGPMKMRANRDGLEVTVTVCMNPSAPNAEVHGEPVDVVRRKKQL